jgi:ribosomal protein S18 acetylase RimI-like enzyme
MAIEDYNQVYRLWKDTKGIGLSEADSRINIEKFLERNKGLSIVCTNNEKIIGTVLAGHDGRRGFIYHLAVTPEYRLKGIAQELVFKSLQKLREEGIEKCHLFVFKDNELGKRFWTKVGWMKREDIEIFSKNNQY